MLSFFEKGQIVQKLKAISTNIERFFDQNRSTLG